VWDCGKELVQFTNEEHLKCNSNCEVEIGLDLLRKDMSDNEITL
jgi:hypothetical protein